MRLSARTCDMHTWRLPVGALWPTTHLPAQLSQPQYTQCPEKVFPPFLISTIAYLSLGFRFLDNV